MSYRLRFSHCAFTQRFIWQDTKRYWWSGLNFGSFDVRGRKVNMGRHWWDERRFGKRAHFHLASANRVARLQISNVSRSDAGHYRCRVDYRNAPTRNFKYHLIVVGKLIHIMYIGLRVEHIIKYCQHFFCLFSNFFFGWVYLLIHFLWALALIYFAYSC